MSRPTLLALLALSAVASAQPASDHKAEADALFDDGKALLASGDIAHACAKFEASIGLVDQLGVRLNLADCYERLGKTASAWAEFREAAAQADRRGDVRAGFAHQRADALAPRLIKLGFVVAPEHRVPGLVVRRDDVALPAEVLGTAVPVDPGEHVIEVSAPGRLPWKTRITATENGQPISVEVPALALAPVPPAPKPAPTVSAAPSEDPIATTRHHRHVLAYGLGIGGVAALTTGILFGVEARHTWQSVGSHCLHDVCDATGAAINHDAHTWGTAGTIVGGVGLAAIAAGAIVYVTAPTVRPAAEHVQVDTSTTRVMVGFRTAF